MLDAFIIEEIRRRERARQESERRRQELPLPSADDRPTRRTDTDKEGEEPPQRGVVVIDFTV